MTTVLLLAALLAQPAAVDDEGLYRGLPRLAAPLVSSVTGSRAEAATFTNTGPVFYWSGGLLVSSADDAPIFAAQIPVGLAGGGTTTAGLLVHQAVKNNVLYSSGSVTGWSQDVAGAYVCGNTSKSPFADARSICKLTDASAVYVADLYQNVVFASAGIANGETMSLCVWAAADDSAQYMSASFLENTGCTSNDVQASKAVVQTGSLLRWTHTRSAGACTGVYVIMYPTQGVGGAGEQGHNYIGFMQVVKGSLCPPIYCHTAAAAVTCGADTDSYALATPVVDGSGNLTGSWRVTVDWTPLVTGAPGVGNILFLSNAGATQWVGVYTNGSAVLLGSQPGGVPLITSGAQSYTAGVPVRFDVRGSYDRDQYELRINGVSAGTATTALTSPTGLVRVYLGTDTAAASQMPGGASLSNFRVIR